MKLLEAHDMFARRTDRSIHDEDMTLDGVDYWPSVMAAGVSLSGMLDDCETDKDLDEAVAHFNFLRESDIVSADQLLAETMDCFTQVVEWAEDYERQEEKRQQAESNLRFVYHGPFPVMLN